MKKLFKSALVLFILMHFALTVHAITSPVESIKEIGGQVDEETTFPNFDDTGVHPDAPPDFAQEGVATATSPILFAIDIIRLVTGTIAFIVVIFASIRLISTANEDEAKKSKDTLIYGLLGLFVIQLAGVAVKNIFFGEQGEAFEDATSAQLFAEEGVTLVRGIIGFIEVFLGVVAVFVLVIRGFTLIGNADDEEELTKAKRHVVYALVGIGVVAISEVVVRGVVFPDAGKELPDVQKGTFILVTLTNYLAGFISIFAFVMLFYAGYQYVVSGGNEESTDKVKKIIMGAVIALILAFGAFALVNTLIEFEPDYLEPPANEEGESPQTDGVDS